MSLRNLKISTRLALGFGLLIATMFTMVVVGLLPIALLHYLTAVAILLFLLSHIYLGTTGKTVGQMFKMMFTGWHEH